jgi:3-methyl-2-oxobutanoate hydroxymethyltransferase
MKETGAQAVKVESGLTVPATIEYMTRRGVPVMGHVGLRPQAVLVDGGFKAKGKDEAGRALILEAEARRTADAGAFAVVIEGVAESLAREITAAIAPRPSASALRPAATVRSWSPTTCWACSTGRRSSFVATPI